MSSDGSVRTIRCAVNAELIVKGSRFIAQVVRINDETEAKRIISRLWEAHPRARHVCYAYRLGPDGHIFRAYDDGEPGGSAGSPILNRLRSHGISNCLATVVRYFGGTKLGVPGLISAYSDTVEVALTDALTVEEYASVTITIRYGHASIGSVDRVIAQQRLEVVSMVFDTDVSTQIKVRSSDLQLVESELARTLGVTLMKG